MTSQLLPLLAPLIFLAGCATGVTPIDAKPSGQEQALVEPHTVVLRVCPMPTHLEISRSCTSETRWSFPVTSGEAPSQAVERADTITATIAAFDVARGTVTLSGPQGHWTVVKAHNPADLKFIRVGDLVSITYSAARSLAMRPLDQS